MIFKYRDGLGSWHWIENVAEFTHNKSAAWPADQEDFDIVIEEGARTSRFEFTQYGETTLLLTDALEAYLINTKGETIDVLVPRSDS